jgi:uncharacterized repeat protein (TIGR03803 family)
MSTSIGRAARLALLHAIVGALSAPVFAGEPAAASYSLVHAFDLAQGSLPRGLVQASDGNVYGVTSSGGKYYDGGEFGGGTLYRITPAGDFTVLHDFGGPGSRDGIEPQGAPMQASDGNLYGVADRGGAYHSGIIYRITPDGVYTIVHSFGRMQDCANPLAGLVQAPDGNLYGTTLYGGAMGIGCVYRFSLDGSEAVIHSFAWHDAHFTQVPLIVGQDGLLYGTSEYGGHSAHKGEGTIFRLSTAGANYEVIHTFWGPDGGYPHGPLIQASDGNFYGTTTEGGAYDGGTVFQLTPDGLLTTLHSFPAYQGDGRWPYSGLLDGGDGFLYGNTRLGGDPSCPGGCGVVFRIAPDGSKETIVHDFVLAKPGVMPNFGEELIRSQDGHLLGTAQGNGGDSPVTGTVYRLGEPAP